MASTEFPNSEVGNDNSDFVDYFLFNFGVGKFKMQPDHQRFLIRHAREFEAAKEGCIDVLGHASNTGNPAFNVTLTKKRAKEVCEFLQHVMGVPAEKFAPYQRDPKTGEAVGSGFGASGVRGKEDGRFRAVRVLVDRKPLLSSSFSE
jgi:hypothetical protein